VKDLNIKEMAEKAGKTELEIIQAIVKILAIKTEVYGEDQHLRISFGGIEPEKES